VIAFVCIAAVMVAPVGAVGAQEGGNYTLSVQNTVDLADRTVTIEGQTFTESSISKVRQGTDITAQVTAPDSDASYTVNLYNNEFQIVQSRSKTGSGTATFDTGSLAPGSYMVGVLEDGEFRAIQSVVVPGYRVTTTTERPGGGEGPGAGPGGVDPGARSRVVHVTVSVTQTAASESPETVQAVLVGDDTTRFVTAEQEDGRYRATIPLVGLDRGSYEVVGAVRGADSLRDGRKVVRGLSRTTTVEITNPTPPPRVGNSNARANDADGDGVYEDVNGDGDVTPGDATVLFNGVFDRDEALLRNGPLFDVNGDGDVTPGDATVLFNRAFEQSQNRAIAATLER
jgi:hypothetical protein